MRASDSRIKPASYQGIDVSGKIVPQVRSSLAHHRLRKPHRFGVPTKDAPDQHPSQ